ncbi:aminotransferase class I/II-fold pyridoxal phosphate-dependent enzyme [Neptunomonas sp.]|uniref:trans-sulfuration enzyme family protein n=1 Tax=Neptunomonas sp. TaxID=1971898 RepID=UPI0025D50211|nr:aminotransferase class I/II-fold pyridoxal phosphate-dependent enzyme [Neptunomonas sp.]
MTSKTAQFSTKVIHAGEQTDPAYNAIITPIVTASSFVKPNIDASAQFSYSRGENPTRHALETCLASLEGGVGAVACASGMAATATVMELLPKDAHVIVTDSVYGGTFRLLEDCRSKTSGFTTTYVDLNDRKAVEASIQDNTALIWIETPTNPLLKLVDLEAIAKIAHKYNILSCVDNTFSSPWNQQPLLHGIDLVMHSTSKYIGGHSDLIGGAVVASNEELFTQLKFVSMAVGAIQGPFDSYLALRGLKTLDLRMQRQSDNALVIACHLEKHKSIEAVFYPGLKSHPQHNLCRRQMVSGGAVIAIRLLGGLEETKRFIARLHYFVLADSLGGVESMINHSFSMSHGGMPAKDKEAAGITENLLRLSVGAESVEDLLNELDYALEVIT